MRDDQKIVDWQGNALEVGDKAIYGVPNPGEEAAAVVTVVAISDYDVDYDDTTQRPECSPPRVTVRFRDGVENTVATHDATELSWDDYPDGPAVRWFQAEALDASLDPPRIIRTPISDRLIVWPGNWFATKPFPYLFHNYDVVSDDRGWWGGFTRRKSAERLIREASESPRAKAERIVDEHGREFREMLQGRRPS